jgi:hypothetical protein
MATVNKRLSKGQISNSITSIYTAPGSAISDVKCITLHNTNSTEEQVKIYYDGSSDSDKILDIFILPLETVEWSPDFPFILNGTETIRASSTTTNKVNYLIHGRETT